MRVLVDDIDAGIDGGTIGEVVTAVSTRLRDQGRIIVDIEVDGRRCVGADLDGVLGDRPSTSPASEVRLTTANTTDQVCETLDAASRELGLADELQQRAAELIESGDSAEGMETLAEALTIWSGVQQTLTLGARLIALPLDRTTVDGVDAAEIIAGLDQRLREMATALQGRDPVGLSDTLLYDMPEITQRWRELLGAMQRSIEIEKGPS